MSLHKAYLKSFLWFATYIVVFSIFSSIFEIIFLDFVHGNPNRSQSNALAMMIVFIPVIVIASFTGALFIFAIPQCFQWLIAVFGMRIFKRYTGLVVTALLPLTVLFTWYSWSILINFMMPADFEVGINDGLAFNADLKGLSLPAYEQTLAFQGPMTIFCMLYIESELNRFSKAHLSILASLAAIVGGIFYGYIMAKGQYQFL